MSTATGTDLRLTSVSVSVTMTVTVTVTDEPITAHLVDGWTHHRRAARVVLAPLVTQEAPAVEQTVGAKELRTSLPELVLRLRRGERFLLLYRSRPRSPARAGGCRRQRSVLLGGPPPLPSPPGGMLVPRPAPGWRNR